MKFYITGQKGFIAKHLKRQLLSAGHEVLDDEEALAKFDLETLVRTGEVCVYRNSEKVFSDLFKTFKVDMVVHNAAVVGTDVVALNPQEAVLSNVHGTYNIVRAANSAGAEICYLGTTVIYNTPAYQSSVITEHSTLKPLTYYGAQKLAGEHIVTSSAKSWRIVRPLFAFGDDGDMNSLIAKTIYAAKEGKKNVDIFLDPNKVKDYLHVSDFCKAVQMICESERTRSQDYNVAAETPHSASQIVEMISKIMDKDVSSIVSWHPNVDYLGNHRLSASKLNWELGWKPDLTLEQGILRTRDWILQSLGYDPLQYLEDAKRSNTDLTQFFPKV